MRRTRALGLPNVVTSAQGQQLRPMRITPILTDYVNAVMVDSPLGFWLLNEGSGTTAIDQAAGRDATYRNIPVLGGLGPACRPCVSYNGTSQTADTTTYSQYAMQASGAWSIEAWIKYTTISTTIQTVCIWRGTTAVNEDEVGAITVNDGYSGRISANIPSGSLSRFKIHSDGAWNDGNWHHVVVAAASGGAATLYIDGVVRGVDSTGRYANNNATRKVGIGSNVTGPSSFSQYFAGSVSCAAIYGSTLSGDRVRVHFLSMGNQNPLYMYQSVVSGDGAVAYWPLDDLSGSTAVERVNGRNGTYNGSYLLANTPVSALLSSSVRLSGTDWVSVLDNDAWSCAGAGGIISVEAWVKPTAVNLASQFIISKFQEWQLRIESNGTVLWDVNTGLASVMSCQSAAALVVNNVYHVVATYNRASSQVRLWINGILAASSNSNSGGTTSNTSNPVWIGGRSDNGGTKFGGVLGHVAIYSGVLTQNQVETHYALANRLFSVQ